MRKCCKVADAFRLDFLFMPMNVFVFGYILSAYVKDMLTLVISWFHNRTKPQNPINIHYKLLKKYKLNFLEWPTQSPDLNIIVEWSSLNINIKIYRKKHVVHARQPKNISELEAFCKEEWVNIHSTRIERLLAGYDLQAVISAKGGVTKYTKLLSMVYKPPPF